MASTAAFAIIGEPYGRYDAIFSYFPIIIFIFHEITPIFKKRQI